MANLLTSADITSLTGVLAGHFDTFKRDVVVFKEPIENIVFTEPSSSFGYPGYNNADLNNPSEITYTAVSGIYSAIVIQKGNNGYNKSEQLRDVNFEGDLAIKVELSAKNYIHNGRTEKILVDDLTYHQSSSEWVQNYLGLKFYYFGLKRTN